MVECVNDRLAHMPAQRDCQVRMQMDQVHVSSVLNAEGQMTGFAELIRSKGFICEQVPILDGSPGGSHGKQHNLHA